jgi:hypothetical protein
MGKHKSVRVKLTLVGENSPPVHVSLDGSNGYDLQIEEGKPITVEFKRDLTLAGNPFMAMRPIIRIEPGDPTEKLTVPKQGV